MRRKLYSEKGSYLGVIDYPQSWDDNLKAFGSARIRMPDPPRVSNPAAPITTTIRTFTITWYLGEPGSVRMTGITLEEFEKLETCAFSPSATYLRSLLP